ncbi:MAG TPA: hypothetical protein PLC05_02585 [bacterium]|nr:hypothetical protein [bacterium]HOR57117.1 hypothetical protein [bacterium]HPL56367.1 hypothetical protein [bacterium]
MPDKQNNLEVLYTRLTHAERLPDRFLTSQAYSTSDPESLHKGTIFGQIEILNPWFPTSQIGQTIINTAIREYYRSTDANDLNNFESALKKVNDTLAQVTQSGETEWVGNLHGILMLISGKDIYISQTGATNAYLFRGQQINHITEGLDDASDAHPLRTFGNIISGTLNEGDKVVIANHAFSEAITLEEMGLTLLNNPPSLAALEFAHMVKRERATPAEAIIIEVTTKEEVASLSLEEKNDTVYLDRGNIGTLWQKIGVVNAFKDGATRSKGSSNSTFAKITKASATVLRSLRSADNFFDKKIKPPVQKVVKSLYKTVSGGVKKCYQKLTRGRETKATRLASSFAKRLSSFSTNIARLFSFGGQAGMASSSRRYGIWGVALIIVLIILVLVTRMQPRPAGTENDAKLQSTVDDLTSRLSRIKLLSAYNDKSVALEEIGSIIEEINSYGSPQDLPPSLSNVRTQTISELGALTNTKNLEMEEVVDWGGRPFIAGFENESYALNQYLVTKVPGNENTTINDIDTLKTIAIDRNDKNIYFLADNNIYLFNSKNKKTDAVKLSAGKWPTAHSFDFFDDNLYFLDKINGALIKFTKQANGFSEGNEYGKPEGEELKRAVDFAINGKLVVLFESGDIVQYTSNGRSAVQYGNLPADGFIKNPQRIFADLDSPNIFALHEDKWINGLWRLSKFTRSGSYVSSWFLPEKGQDWEAVDLDIGSATMWIITSHAIGKTKI